MPRRVLLACTVAVAFLGRTQGVLPTTLESVQAEVALLASMENILLGGWGLSTEVLINEAKARYMSWNDTCGVHMSNDTYCRVNICNDPQCTSWRDENAPNSLCCEGGNVKCQIDPSTITAENQEGDEWDGYKCLEECFGGESPAPAHCDFSAEANDQGIAEWITSGKLSETDTIADGFVTVCPDKTECYQCSGHGQDHGFHEGGDDAREKCEEKGICTATLGSIQGVELNTNGDSESDCTGTYSCYNSKNGVAFVGPCGYCDDGGAANADGSYDAKNEDACLMGVCIDTDPTASSCTSISDKSSQCLTTQNYCGGSFKFQCIEGKCNNADPKQSRCTRRIGGLPQQRLML